MDALSEILDIVTQWLLGGVVIPFMEGLASLMSLCFLPVSGLSPAVQVGVAALLGALLSILLTHLRKGRLATESEGRFKERLGARKNAGEIDDKALRSAVYKGLDQEADEAYEALMLDTFFEFGMTYLFPMFLFLIWVEYHAFSPDRLEMLTGMRGLLLPGISQAIGAGTLYLYLYNGVLMSVSLGRWGMKKVRRRKVTALAT